MQNRISFYIYLYLYISFYISYILCIFSIYLSIPIHIFLYLLEATALAKNGQRTGLLTSVNCCKGLKGK